MRKSVGSGKELAERVPLVVTPSPVRVEEMGVTRRTVRGDRASTHLAFLEEQSRKRVVGRWGRLGRWVEEGEPRTNRISSGMLDEEGPVRQGRLGGSVCCVVGSNGSADQSGPKRATLLLPIASVAAALPHNISVPTSVLHVIGHLRTHHTPHSLDSVSEILASFST